MRRFAKTFAQPMIPDEVGPKSNKFTIDLAGLDLREEDLQNVRSAAVKSAMQMAGKLLRGQTKAFDYFGTFSTFSTFSTFGSGASSPFELGDDLDAGAKKALEQTLKQRGA